MAGDRRSWPAGGAGDGTLRAGSVWGCWLSALGALAVLLSAVARLQGQPDRGRPVRIPLGSAALPWPRSVLPSCCLLAIGAVVLTSRNRCSGWPPVPRPASRPGACRRPRRHLAVAGRRTTTPGFRSAAAFGCCCWPWRSWSPMRLARLRLGPGRPGRWRSAGRRSRWALLLGSGSLERPVGDARIRLACRHVLARGRAATSCCRWARSPPPSLVACRWACWPISGRPCERRCCRR